MSLDTKIGNFNISSDKGSVTATSNLGSSRGIVLNRSKLYVNDDNGEPKFSLLQKPNSIAEITNNNNSLSIVSLLVQEQPQVQHSEPSVKKCDKSSNQNEHKLIEKKCKCDDKSVKNALSDIKDKLNNIKNKLPLEAYFIINGDITEIYQKILSILPDRPDTYQKEYNGLQWLCYPVYFNNDLSLLTTPMTADNVSSWQTSSASTLANSGVFYGNSYEFGHLIESTTSTNSSNLNAFNGGSQYQYSVIWRGYFKPNVSGTWTITTTSDDASYVWINNDNTTPITDLDAFSETNPSVCGITTSNSIVKTNVSTASISVPFTAGKVYETVLLYGQHTGPSNFSITMKDPNNITISSNFSGLFINYVSN